MKPIKSLILEASVLLEEKGVAEPLREAGSLMRFALNKDASFLRGYPEYIPENKEFERFTGAVERRAAREPFQHIVGFQEFYGLEFEVNRDVLIPRPETELIVETGITILKGNERPLFLEIGIGSGCVSVALLKHLPQASAVAVDISKAAVAVAGRNSKLHGVEDRLEIVVSDVYEAIAPSEQFDLIVSNPPYISSKEISGLQPEVGGFDPQIALTDGLDGLSIIERIVRSAHIFLRPEGWLVMEIGIGQAKAVESMFSDQIWKNIETKPDLSSIPRATAAQKKGENR